MNKTVAIKVLKVLKILLIVCLFISSLIMLYNGGPQVKSEITVEREFRVN